MNLLIKSVKIVWENSEFNNQILDVHIQNGIIQAIGPNLDFQNLAKQNTELWQQEESYLSPGWFDLDANMGEPGFETREDLNSGSNASLRGGFTGIALMPNSEPPLQSKTQIEYIVGKSKNLGIDIYPIGTLSKNREGKEMAELFDMFQSGALVFCDGDRAVQNSGILLRALQYSSTFGAKVFSYPEDYDLSGNAKVHEGIQSLKLGMKGIPNLAEEIMIQRDLMIASYANSPIHFITISGAESVELIRQAKKLGQKVTASVPSYHLFLEDSNLQGFDTNYKVRPPLRGKSDREALLVGIQDGTIDAITTRHTPQEPESKEVEFENALDGMISLETSFSTALMSLEKLVTIERIVNALSFSPRKIMGLSQPELKVGHIANFCWFDPSKEWIYEKKSIAGKSSNSPFLGKTLKGKVLGTIHKQISTKF